MAQDKVRVLLNDSDGQVRKSAREVLVQMQVD
jgi:hypothetical protein